MKNEKAAVPLSQLVIGGQLVASCITDL